jgi:hypothetical protein
MICGKITGNIDCLWVGVDPIRVADFVRVPNESGRLIVDRISQLSKLFDDFSGRDVNLLRFHSCPRAWLNPLVALERASKRIRANIDGIL